MIGRPATSEDVLEPVGHLMVKSVAGREGSPECAALFDVAMGSQIEWTPADVAQLELRLDTCRLKVRDWILLQ